MYGETAKYYVIQNLLGLAKIQTYIFKVNMANVNC